MLGKRCSPTSCHMKCLHVKYYDAIPPKHFLSRRVKSEQLLGQQNPSKLAGDALSSAVSATVWTANTAWNVYDWKNCFVCFFFFKVRRVRKKNERVRGVRRFCWWHSRRLRTSWCPVVDEQNQCCLLRARFRLRFVIFIYTRFARKHLTFRKMDDIKSFISTRFDTIITRNPRISPLKVGGHIF